MENTTQPQAQQVETSQPKDPIDVIRDHVVAVQKFGFSIMSMHDILNMIDRAKHGELGEFDVKKYFG